MVFKVDGAGGDVGGVGNPIRVDPKLGNGCPQPDYVYRRMVEVVQLRRGIGSKQPTPAIHLGRTVVISKQDIQILR